MSEKEHTPGPWKWEKQELIPGQLYDMWLCGPIYKPATGNLVMNVTIREKESFMPDARLIAAAPELLQACEKAMKLLDILKNLLDITGETETSKVELISLITNVVPQILKTIRKAKGEEL